MIKIEIVGISELSRYIKQLMDYDQVLSRIWLRGEISNFKRHTSGHCYFTLKDSGSLLRSVMFKGNAANLKFAPRDGMKVLASGRVTVFERDGQYQLYVEQLRPEGAGEISLAYEELKARLYTEGLFAQERKKFLPAYPRHVGLITSRTGAALQDMLKVAKKRNPAIPITVFPAAVQGENAPQQLMNGLEYFNEHPTVDVIIIGRGGGSLEELNAFNDERLVRMIAASKCVTVSAVGHETDYMISDFVADVRAATPSQACEIVFPVLEISQKRVLQLRNDLTDALKAMTERQRRKLQSLIDAKAFGRVRDLLQNMQQQLDLQTNRLQQNMRQTNALKLHRWQLVGGKLAALNPLKVLARGYSILEKSDGKIIRSWHEVKPQESVRANLAEGQLELVVIKGNEV